MPWTQLLHVALSASAPSLQDCSIAASEGAERPPQEKLELQGLLQSWRARLDLTQSLGMCIHPTDKQIHFRP